MKEIEKIESMSLDELEYTLVMDSRSSLMIVDDEDVVRLVFEQLLESSGHRITFAASAGEALQRPLHEEIDLLVVDKNLPDMSGLELARRVREKNPLVDFMVITGYASYESAVEALRLGALDYIEKPFDDIELLRHKIERAIEFQKLHAENSLLAEQLRQAHRRINQLGRRAESTSPSGISANGQLQLAAELLRQANGLLTSIAAGQKVQRSQLVQLKHMLAEAWRQLATALAQA